MDLGSRTGRALSSLVLAGLARPRWRHPILRTAWLALAAASTAPLHAQTATATFDIPAMPLADALTRFAEQSGEQVLFAEASVLGKHAVAVQGRMPVTQALERLLAGTGVIVTQSQAGVHTLRPAPVTRMQTVAVVGQRNDEAEGKGIYTPDALSVTASRSGMTPDAAPQTMRLIGRDEIQRQLAITSNSSAALSNLLPSYTPSRDKMNGSGETLRGRLPLILVDGIPQSNPLRPSGREAHTIDFAMADRVEVIQGANAYNGLGAAGGIINIVTRRPDPGSMNQNVSVQTTLPTEDIGEDTASYKASYRVNGRTGNLEYLLAASYEDQGLYLDGAGRAIAVDTTQGDLMNSRTYDVLGKLGYWLSGDEFLQLSVNRYRIKGKMGYVGVPGDRNTGLPSTSVRGTPPGLAPWNDVWSSALSYSHHDLAGMTLSAMAFHQKFEGLFGAANSATFQDPALAPLGDLYDQSRSLATKYGTKLALTKDDWFEDRMKLTLGADTLVDKGEQDLFLTRRTYVPPSEFRNLSLFAQAEYRLLDDVALHAGVRREIASLDIGTYQTLAANHAVTVEGGTLDFRETLFNAGLVYDPTPWLTVFGSYAEGFAMPDIGRVLRTIDTPGQSVSQMRNLTPILTRNAELGARLRHGPLQADLSVYRSRSDLGARVRVVDNVGLMSREKTEIDGFEASLGYRLNPRHQMRVAYAHTRGRYDSNEDGVLDARLNGLNIAPNRVIAAWSADWSERFGTFVQVNHAFSRSFDDPRHHFSGYTLVDAAANYRLSRGVVTLAVANVFNRKYISYLSQTSTTEPLRYFSGRGRTVTLGYSLDL